MVELAKILDRITLVTGNITSLDVDAIVNAANRSLLGGGGVDGAIHEAAGPELLAECRTLGDCKTGDAKVTGGHNLPARHVIHTVGPVFRSLERDASRLASCYRRSLEQASMHNIATVAFPGISTGVYRFSAFEISKEQRETLHAKNERMHVATFVRGIEFYRALVSSL